MKKGQISTDSLIPIIMVMLFAFSGVLGWVMLQKFDAEAQGKFPQLSLDAIQRGADILSFLDTLTPIFYALMITILVYSASKIPTNPIFLIPTFVIGIFLIVVAGQLANLYDSFINSGSVSAAKSSFTMSTSILANAPKYVGISFLVLIVALFAKRRGVA